MIDRFTAVYIKLEIVKKDGKSFELQITNERKSEQAHILHAPTLLENAVYNEWQFQAL